MPSPFNPCMMRRPRWEEILGPEHAGRRISLARWHASIGREGWTYELIDGRLCVYPFPELIHDDLRTWLYDQLSDYERSHPNVVEHMTSKASVHVLNRPGPTVATPDLAVYFDFRLDVPISKRRWEDVSPAIVGEIIEEPNEHKDLTRNVDVYLCVPSIREYWIIDPRRDPDRPTLTVYRRRGQRWQKPIVVPFGGTYVTRLVPGFTLVVDPG